MPSAYRWADLVVARAGGSTLAELAIVGVGVILVPLATAIDDHQTANARHFAHGGAGLLIPEQQARRGGARARARRSAWAMRDKLARDGRRGARAGAA